MPLLKLHNLTLFVRSVFQEGTNSNLNEKSKLLVFFYIIQKLVKELIIKETKKQYLTEQKNIMKITKKC